MTAASSAWIAPAISAGASIVGDLMSSAGQSQSDAMGKAEFISAQNFNKAQSDLNRQFQLTTMGRQDAFSAAQAQKQQNFQWTSQKEAEKYNSAQTAKVEDWETMLSDTAMQRRVADLKAAGLNPLLAVGAGGASSPMIGAPSVGTLPGSFGGPAPGAPGSALPSPGQVIQPNPMGAFGNLGPQTAAAMALRSQASEIALNKANADYVTSKTPSGNTIDPDTGEATITVGPNHDLGDAQLKNIQASTGLMGNQSLQVKANVDFIHSQMKNVDSQTAVNNITEMLKTQEYGIVAATKQYLIMQQAALGAAAKNQAWVQDGTFGKVIAGANAILQPVSTAAGAAGKVGLGVGALGLLKGGSTAPQGTFNYNLNQ